ncbi:MAG: divalent-cation tolerance protein CutA [Alphaproteobacteria bacterium]|nr:divalent-cation tolerance protein CutA [Alphaproteobacteria bacterium]
MSFVFAYVTVPEDAAKKLAATVVEERLAACANILPGMTSVYRWRGKIEEGAEAVVIFKTQADLFPVLKDRITALHSYDTPCIIALPVVDGHQPFLEWIQAETVSVS